MCLHFINRDKTNHNNKLNYDYNLALTWVTILNYASNKPKRKNKQSVYTEGKLTEYGDKYYSFSIHKCNEWCKY